MIVLKQRVDADRVLAGQMVVDDGIGQREELAMAAIGALDVSLVAEAFAPLIRAGGRVARVTLPTLPAHWIDVVTAAEEVSKQCHLLRRRER